MNDVLQYSFAELKQATLRLAKKGIDVTDIIEQLAIVMPDKLLQLRQQVKQLNSPSPTLSNPFETTSHIFPPLSSDSSDSSPQHESVSPKSNKLTSEFGYEPGAIVSPKKGLTPYGWIGPEGNFYHVPGFAKHSKAESALKENGTVPYGQWIEENHLHVSPEGMRLPENLTEKHLETLQTYRDQVMGGHPNFQKLNLLGRKHIDDFTNDARQTMDRNYEKGLSLSASFPEGLNQVIKKANSNRKCVLCGQDTDSHAAGCATNMNVQDSAHNYTKKGQPRKIGPATTKALAPLHSKADLNKTASHIEMVDIPMKDIEMDSDKEYNFFENYQLNKVLHTYLKLFVYQTLSNFTVESAEREGDTLKVKVLVFDHQVDNT